MEAAPIATIAPTAMRLRRPSNEPPYATGAAFAVFDAVLLVLVAEAVPDALPLVESETRAVSVSSVVNEPVTPEVFVHELGRFELTPDTNLTAAH